MAALWFEWILLSCVRGTDWRRPDPKSINHHTSSACLHKEKNTNIINHISPFMYMGYLCSKSNISKLHTMCTGRCWGSAGTFLILVSEQTAYPLFFSYKRQLGFITNVSFYWNLSILRSQFTSWKPKCETDVTGDDGSPNNCYTLNIWIKARSYAGDPLPTSACGWRRGCPLFLGLGSGSF